MKKVKPDGLLAKSGNSRCLVGLLLAVCIVWQPVSALAQQSADPARDNGIVIHSDRESTVTVPLYKSKIVGLEKPVKRVSIGNADIADILILRSRQLYIQGKDLGTTNVLLWDSSDNLVAGLNVEVTHDLASLKEKLHQLLPGETVHVQSSQGTLVLSGEVSSAAKLDTAMKIARSFAMKSGGEEEESDTSAAVVNLMQVGGSHQVMLKVTVAEVSRTVLRKLGVQFNALGFGDDNWTVGGVNGGAAVPGWRGGGNEPFFFEAEPTVPVIDDHGLFGSFLSETFVFNATIEASKSNGSAKILAEPTLTTLSGQEARFLSGGEFPIPVPRGDNGVTIEFKEFGIGLKFLPVVLDSNRINLRINVSVSELVSASSIALRSDDTTTQFFVPALSSRSAYSTVELADGQTIGIAGLISEDTRDAVNKFPGLGDVPVLGHLFRSQEFEKGETELVIMVTPQLALPVNEAVARLPTDSYVEPSEWEFYLLGRTGGVRQDPVSGLPVYTQSSNNRPAAAVPGTRGGVEGSFGHVLDNESE